MGSGGRGESLLRPDQDNGFILEDHPDTRRPAVDRYFYELADRMTRALDDAGLPLCKGYVMATNPSWRKQLSEWQAQILGWLKKPSIAATTLTDICIDFSHVHGDPALVERLRAFTHKEIPKHHGFLRELEALQFDHDVAITPFRTLKRERLPGQSGHRQVDVKRKGIMPLVEGTRILALAHGVAGTATLERLDGLTAGGHIHSALAEQVRYAFEFLTGLLLRAQISARRAGHTPEAYIAPESLAAPEREQLRAALATAATLRAKVHGDFTAELF
jgi:signal-transduction protein with cAMP-binding, CBS, and nucleotidyltransferase domain